MCRAGAIFTLAVVIMLLSIKVKIMNCCKQAVGKMVTCALDACLCIAGLFNLRLVDKSYF